MNRYKDETITLCRRKGWDRVPLHTVWLLFTEEVGELASAIRQHTKTFKKTNLVKDRGTDVEMELADVFSYLFQIAGIMNIDLDKMWQRHKAKNLTRNYNITNKINEYSYVGRQQQA